MLEEDSSTPYKILSVTWGQWPSLSSPSSDKALPLLLNFRICSSLLHGFQKSKSVHLCVASHSASHKSREQGGSHSSCHSKPANTDLSLRTHLLLQRHPDGKCGEAATAVHPPRVLLMLDHFLYI